MLTFRGMLLKKHVHMFLYRFSQSIYIFSFYQISLVNNQTSVVLEFREGVAYLNGPQQLDFEAAVVHRGLAHEYTPGYLVSNEFVIGHDQYPG